ncbi:MAG: TraB/GumN family protein [Alphaproteobacteria bacterium]
MKFAIVALRRLGAAAAVFLTLLTPAFAEGPALWRVDGGPEPVFLFGTFHLLPPEAEWQTPEIETAFERADVLVVEVRLDSEAIAETQKVIKEKAFLERGSSLRDYLSPEDEAAYEKIGNRLGMYPAVLDNFRPWYASLLLTVALYQEQGFRPDSGAEAVLRRQARAAGMPVQQLETAREQIEFLADMPEKVQVAMLKSVLHEAETVPEQINALLNAWMSGDVELIDGLLNEGMREFPEVYDRLLVQRNRNWLPAIEKMIADNNSYFIAVGSAHLVGKDSVTAMLREQGYEVEGP